MQKWKYIEKDISSEEFYKTGLIPILNSFGEEGWEFVSYKYVEGREARGEPNFGKNNKFRFILKQSY